ncbi:hypothetical protein F9B85_00035 [Heliorestis acidaminivorans]|uniref:Phasin family protein n=1 Tax=Heliorestis acidaminivorans TaxID=553427 RepID=A0A6I0F217_9FIRM|nr:hypothetical protein [Heliorestis acidaminivorans]KAB2954131.1 hypothetical protein F9B85_00035 [Heliorestis acidaminivorans]
MKDVFRKTMMAGLGAITITKEKAEQLAEELVKKGELSKDEASKMVTEVLEKSREQKEALSETVKTEFSRIRGDMGLITRQEFEGLEARIAVIEEKLGIIREVEVIDQVVEENQEPQEPQEPSEAQAEGK